MAVPSQEPSGGAGSGAERQQPPPRIRVSAAAAGEEGSSPTVRARSPVEAELASLRALVQRLVQQREEDRGRRGLGLAPARVSDLMRGLQSAMARANETARQGQAGAVQLERMAIRDLEVTLSAPVIQDGHDQDPVLMLPNVKSVDADSPQLTLKFRVTSVPLAERR